MEGWKKWAAVLGLGLSLLPNNVFSGGDISGGSPEANISSIEKKFSLQNGDDPKVKEHFFDKGGRKVTVYISEDPSSSYNWSDDVWGRKDSTACECLYDEGGFAKKITLSNNLAVKTTKKEDFLPASFYYEVERFGFENDNGSVRPEYYGPGIAFIGNSNSYSEGEADFNYSKKYSMSRVSNLSGGDLSDRMRKVHKACQKAEEGNYAPIKELVEEEHARDNYLSVKNVHGGADGSYPLDYSLSNTIIDGNFLKGFYKDGRVGALAW